MLVTASPTPLAALLTRIRTLSASPRDIGAAFEHLSLRYLQTEPEYRRLYAQVQRYQDWVAAHPALEMPSHDIGIDLVATTVDGAHHAVQCKCYAPDHAISKADIDSFISASGHQAFSARLLIDTTAKPWGGNAEAVLAQQRIPVTRIGLKRLEDSAIDWSRYSVDQPDAALALKAKHKPRPYQKAAINAVLSGLREHERGKLIMACGTGKTFTSLKIAEQQAGAGKTVLFLVPSLSLLSQTLTEWSQQTETPITAFAVCSDSEVGKRGDKQNADDNDRIVMRLHDLAYPATTDAASLAKQHGARHGAQAMTVIFSTYHSIEVIAQAQQQHGLAAIDLVIGDEAHRTTGQTWEGDDESAFVRVHDPAVINAHKRLYMTATPRIYSSEAKKKQDDSLTLYSMDDAAVYGPTFHTLSFSQAVEQDLLVPYKVVVLTIAEQEVDDILKDYLTRHVPDAESVEVNDAAKIVGCFKALAKFGMTDLADDPRPMQRAVAFCQVIGEDSKGAPIKTSKTAARHVAKTFADVVDSYQNQLAEDERIDLACALDYVHGAMGAKLKDDKLAWLKAEPETQPTCRILTNVRCLSEGVDVPALDAVLFLTPRNSQIDVVQSVGRVMRKSPGKKRGYIILPVVIPYGKDPKKALDDNKTYQVVWQVLQALKAHDDEFERMINRIELMGSDPSKIQVIDPIGLSARRAKQSQALRERAERLHSAQRGHTIGQAGSPPAEQGKLDIQTGEIERAILAKVVKKVGQSDYWEQWATDIARIAQMQISRIGRIMADPSQAAARAAFDGFAAQLHEHINPSVSHDEIVEMLAQHLITRPVFDALFGSSDFTRANPISQALQAVTDALARDADLEREQQSLDAFYAHIRKKTAGITDPQARQTLIVTLYDQFFAQAFPRVTQKHGIVYTPVEIVDFILHSVAHVLQTQFGKSLADPDVQVLDPFTGTGTFIARLVASALIDAADLPRVYAQQLHATEILLLPYYIAAVNIESTFAQRFPGEPYTPFPGILLADTFHIPTRDSGHWVEKLEQDALAANHARRKRQMDSKITVIVGNPPYSVGQKSQNDNNQNVSYDKLDKRIIATYAAKSRAASKKSLRDSYIRAIRWASDRIDPATGGVIGFVTNAGWLKSMSTDGLRRCLVQEFSSLHIFDLRGDIRSQIRSHVKDKKEGDNVFGQGSTTGVVISLLVKQAQHNAQTGQIYYHDIGDYLSREDKLATIAELGSVAGIDAQGLWQTLTPDAHGDWLNQRQGGFDDLLAMGDAKLKNKPGNTGMFENFSLGVASGRDPWCNNPSRTTLLANVRRMVEFYEQQRQTQVNSAVDNDPSKISWSSSLLADLVRNKPLAFNPNAAVPTLYRPFTKAWLYYDRRLNERVYQMPQLFPLPGAHEPDDTQAGLFAPLSAAASVENRLICVSGVGSRRFAVLMTDHIPSLDCIEKGQCFPRYLYDAQGHRRDGITDATLQAFQKHYGNTAISKDDIFHYVYAVLHHPHYRETWAHNLTKSLPRIPFAASYQDFLVLADAGLQLGDLHVNYESTDRYDGVTVTGADRGHFRVEKMRFGAGKDRTTIRYNAHITIKNIPLEAYDYVVNGRSPIEWVIDRQCVKTDKDSSIVSDANAYATQTVNNPRYPLDLLLRAITVSLRTQEVVRNLSTLALPTLHNTPTLNT